MGVPGDAEMGLDLSLFFETFLLKIQDTLEPGRLTHLRGGEAKPVL